MQNLGLFIHSDLFKSVQQSNFSIPRNESVMGLYYKNNYNFCFLIETYDDEDNIIRYEEYSIYQNVESKLSLVIDIEPAEGVRIKKMPILTKEEFNKKREELLKLNYEHRKTLSLTTVKMNKFFEVCETNLLLKDMPYLKKEVSSIIQALAMLNDIEINLEEKSSLAYNSCALQ